MIYVFSLHILQQFVLIISHYKKYRSKRVRITLDIERMTIQKRGGHVIKNKKKEKAGEK